MSVQSHRFFPPHSPCQTYIYVFYTAIYVFIFILCFCYLLKLSIGFTASEGNAISCCLLSVQVRFFLSCIVFCLSYFHLNMDSGFLCCFRLLLSHVSFDSMGFVCACFYSSESFFRTIFVLRRTKLLFFLRNCFFNSVLCSSNKIPIGKRQCT